VDAAGRASAPRRRRDRDRAARDEPGAWRRLPAVASDRLPCRPQQLSTRVLDGWLSPPQHLLRRGRSRNDSAAAAPRRALRRGLVSSRRAARRLLRQRRRRGKRRLATAAPLGDFGKALLGTDVEAVPPTGRSIDLPAVFVHEVRDELVVAERQYWGLLEFLVQIGVVGVSATRGAEAARRPGGSSSARDPQASTGQWPVAAALRREAGAVAKRSRSWVGRPEQA